MATIYNSDLTKEIVDSIKASTSRDILPSQIAEKVVPVIEVNPKMLRRVNIVKNATSSATGTVTLYTTPSDRDFYLTSASLTLEKDAACDNVLTELDITPFGQAAVACIIFPTITLTATSKALIINYEPPIKLSRSSGISIFGNKAAGNFTKGGSITGYVVETS